MNQEKIGKFIYEKRKEKGLTQQDLANKLGVTNKAVSKWENGKCMPDLAIIKDLCNILDITITTLLNGEETSDEKVIIRLLWIIDKFKQLSYAFIGILIFYFSDVIKCLGVLKWVKDKDFIKGFLDGTSVGLKVIGVFIFIYGIISYIKKNLESKKKFIVLKI